jgi:hypothetical protein
VKTLSSGANQPIEGGRQDMLPGVLLHVLEATAPVNLPADWPRFQLPFDHMPDHLVVSIDHVDDHGGAELTSIEGLPAGGRIEGGPIQHHGATIAMRFDPENRRVELGQI